MEEEVKKKKPFWRDALEVIVTVAVITFVLLHFVLIPVEVDGSSMYPTLVDGDRGYSFIISKNLGIKRFDICVVDVDDEKLLVKRIIGLPGEHIEVKENILYINGEAVEQDFLEEEVFTSDFSYDLGEEEYFCLGDNRERSRDSRYYGPFSKSQIRSTKIFVVYPFSRIGMK